MDEPALNHTTIGASREVHQLLGLVVALAVIYGIMLGLSAIEPTDSFWMVGSWRLRAPILLMDRNGHIDWTNQRNILEQGAINVVLGVGMTLIILSGEIDLSVGSLLTLCNVLYVVGASPTDGLGRPIYGVLLAVGAGLVAGFINGSLTAVFKLPSFVVTLGMLMAAAGTAHLVTIGVSSGQPMFHMCPSPAKHLIPVISSIGMVAIAWVVLTHTRFGRHIYAVGGSAEAARLSGISPVAVKIGVFVICGMTAALAGIVKWARVSSGTHVVEEPFELYAIAAAVVGGTSMMGGRGNVLGTFVGALIIAVLVKGLNTLGVHESVQKIIIGAVIIIAVLYDRRRQTKLG